MAGMVSRCVAYRFSLLLTIVKSSRKRFFPIEFLGSGSLALDGPSSGATVLLLAFDLLTLVPIHLAFLLISLTCWSFSGPGGTKFRLMDTFNACLSARVDW